MGLVGYLVVYYVKHIGLWGGVNFGLCAGAIIDVRVVPWLAVGETKRHVG